MPVASDISCACANLPKSSKNRGVAAGDGFGALAHLGRVNEEMMRNKPAQITKSELPDMPRVRELLEELNSALADLRKTAEPPAELVREHHALTAERAELEAQAGEQVLRNAFAGRAAPAGSGRIVAIDRRLGEIQLALNHLPRVRNEFMARVAEAQEALRSEFACAVADMLAKTQLEAVAAFRRLRDLVSISADLQLEMALPIAVPPGVTALVPALRDDDGELSSAAQAIKGELQPIRRAFTIAERTLSRL